MVRPAEQAEGAPQHVPEGRRVVPQRLRLQDRAPHDGGPHALHLQEADGGLPGRIYSLITLLDLYSRLSYL